jgi:superoxide dismutase, Fe-Mn family
MITLPSLPYEPQSLEPIISQQTLDFHYGRHHQGYVTTLNSLLQSGALGDTFSSTDDLQAIIQQAASQKNNLPQAQGVFNNAAQVWTHAFYWHSLAPTQSGKAGKNALSADLSDAIARDFGGIESLEKTLHDQGLAQFGSGWVWLACTKDGTLSVHRTPNAELIWLEGDLIPLAILDVWEHAYYLDYQNRRSDHLKQVIAQLLNWDFASKNFQSKTLFTLEAA